MSTAKPFLLVNSGSGGGRTQDSIVAKAQELGVDYHVVQPGDDFDHVLTVALDRGADVLAAAGGDGTLCAVANIAMGHDLPMVVVPAGTRNHFALDVGLDLDDPVGVLHDSLTSGFERRVDVGTINDVTFLNNVSLGLYATAVSHEDYREHKVKAFIAAAREADSKDTGGQATLSLPLPGSSMTALTEGTSTLIVVNNAYSPGFAPGKRLRARLDAGQVWLYVGGGQDREDSGLDAMVHTVGTALNASLLRAAFGTDRVTITTDAPHLPIAVDGENRPDLAPPFEFASRHEALRLLVPNDPTPRSVDVLLSW